MPSLTFVVPCYNEKGNITATIASIKEAMLSFPHDFEIVIVDDGSTDNTLALARAAARADERIKVIHNEVNQGFGAAYKVGVAHATKSHVMLIPGDDGFSSSNIRRVIPLIGSADIVIPYVTNSFSRGVLRHSFHVLFTCMFNSLFLNRIRYYNGPVVHQVDLLRGVPIETNGFGHQAEALTRLLVAGATFVQVPVAIQERSAGVSTAISARNCWLIIKMAYRLLTEIGLFRTWRFPPAKWAKEIPVPPSAKPAPELTLIQASKKARAARGLKSVRRRG